jgi:HPt (histidine-containing phosphotransfer) domain-containing protein
MDTIQQADLPAALDRMWTRFLPEIRQQVEVLESAAAALAAHILTLPEQQAAIVAAHKLAGVLGTFGLARGTVLARELELMYSQETGPDPAAGKRLAAITAELRALVESRK